MRIVEFLLYRKRLDWMQKLEWPRKPGWSR